MMEAKRKKKLGGATRQLGVAQKKDQNVTMICMSASQTEMHTLSVVSVLISGKLTDGCMHSRPLAVKRSEFVNGSGAQGQHSVTVCSRASSGGQDPYPQVLLVVRAPRHIVCIESFRIWIHGFKCGW